jgi:ATP-dependent RNA helicase SUPV3L1/SUV3
MNAAAAALRPVLAARAAAIAAAGDSDLMLDDQARIVWRGEAIATLEAGAERLKPTIQVLCDERLEAPDRLRIEARLRAWLTDHIGNVLRPLVAAVAADAPASVRGIVFHLAENTGAIPRAEVESQLSALGDAEREALARLGIRFGRDSVFMPALMKSAPIRLRGLLWIAANRANHGSTVLTLPPPGRVTFAVSEHMPGSFIAACGYRIIADTAYRLDMLERFGAIVRKLARDKVKVLPPEHLSLLGVSAEGAVPVLKHLGFRAKIEEAGLTFEARKRHAMHGRPAVARKAEVAVREDSPFAKLKTLIAS